MVPLVALQLYTVRDYLTRHYAGVMQHVAEVGYLGVETSHVAHISAKEAARAIRSCGLEIPSAYTHLPIGDRKIQVLDMMATLGCKRIVASFSKSEVATLDAVRRSCELVNQASVIAARHRIQIGLHNHWWEFAEIAPGLTAYDAMLESLDAAVFLEVDTYWAKTAGVDPAGLVRRLGRRAPILHLKDGPCVRGEPMVALGEGQLDFPAILAAADDAVEWLIVELDACATDMMEAVERSYCYLISQGLGRGRQA